MQQTPTSYSTEGSSFGNNNNNNNNNTLSSTNNNNNSLLLSPGPQQQQLLHQSLRSSASNVTNDSVATTSAYTNTTAMLRAASTTDISERALPPLWPQFRLCMWKTILIKRRRPVATFCEGFLPVVLLVMLVIGWSFSDDDSFGDMQYIDGLPPFVGPIFDPDVDYFQNSTFICNWKTFDKQMSVSGLRNCTGMWPPWRRLFRPGFAGIFLHFKIPALYYHLSTIIPQFDTFYTAYYERINQRTLDKFKIITTPYNSSGARFVREKLLETTFMFRETEFSRIAKPHENIEFTSMEDALACMVKTNCGANTLWALIDFSDWDEAKQKYHYHIRMNITLIPHTYHLYNPFPSGGLASSHYYEYLGGGFLSLQRAIDEAILKDLVGVPEHEIPRPAATLFPTAAYTQYDFLTRAGPLIPSVLVLSYVYFVSMLVKGIVEEKETRVREGMLIMGVRQNALYLSWLVSYLVISLLSSIGATLTMMLTFYPHTGPTVLCTFLFLFSVSLVGFSFALSTLFSKAKLAATIAPLVVVATAIPIALLHQDTNTSYKLLLCVPFSTSTFQMVFSLITNYEAVGRGLQWSDFASSNDDPGLYTLFLLLLFNIGVYFVVALYMDLVMPSEFGVRERPLFFLRYFSPAYWMSRSKCADMLRNPGNRIPDDFFKGVEESATVEGIPEGRQPSIVIRNLRKAFTAADGSTFNAVDGLNLALFEGHLQVLLGHNGAGKTTTIGMLTGMLPPTSGECYVYGHSIHTDMPAIRRSLGFCPQHNILWPTLTVDEHLTFFAAIKGYRGFELRQAVENMVEAVELKEKQHAYSSVLSGGQKRKLSVGMALIGGSRVVFLDEPTAGMDVSARHHMWSLLRKMTLGRTIVLTTHYMDEADVLGKSIAIMHRGQLNCWGSSAFLKSRLGVGYTLNVAITAQADIARICRMVFSRVPSAQNASKAAGELQFRLPTETTRMFPRLFDDLEGPTAAEAGVTSFGIGVTTLEEIFLKIAMSDENEPAAAAEASLPVLTRSRDMDLIHSSLDIENELAGGTEEEQELLDGDGAPNSSSSHSGASGGEYANKSPILKRKANAKAKDIKNKGSGLCTSVQGSDHDMENDAFERDNENENVPLLSQRRGTGGGGDHDDDHNDGSADFFAVPESERSHGTALLLRQFYGLFVKRMNYARRDRRVQFCNIVLPVLTLILAMLVKGIHPPDEPVLWLNEGMYAPRDGTLVLPIANCPQTVFNEYKKFGYHTIDYGQGQTMQMTSQKLLDTVYKHGGEQRWAAVSCLSNLTLDRMILWHNSTSWHTLPATLRAVRQVAAWKYQPNASIQVSTQPLPLTDHELQRISNIQSMLIALFVLIPFCLLPANYVSFLVKERETKSKHVQVVSGVNMVCFWLSSYLVDMITYMITTTLAMCVFIGFHREEYIGDYATMSATMLTLFLYGLSSTSCVYATNFAFSNHSTAQNVTMMTNLVCGFFLVVGAFVMDLLPDTKHTNSILKYIYRLVPSYCLGEGIINLAGRSLRQNSFGIVQEPFSWDCTGALILYMSIEAPFFFLLTLVLDSSMWQRLRRKMEKNATDAIDDQPYDEDEDVVRERAAVNAYPEGRPGDRVTVKGLRKVWPPTGNTKHPKIAVRRLHFGVKDAEIFGFLGTNGAGKTTTMSILSGEYPPTEGTGTVGGYDIVTELDQLRRQLGYCPQFDALLDLLTPEEHLYLYARLRGIPEPKIKNIVHALLKRLDLTAHKDKLCHTLSGGNKRKTSIAIALVGGPSVLFLDEPSAGMDPVARRGLWNTLQRVSSGRSVILTTHHLEEVEALCHRMAIMTEGRLQCIGSLQHLKSKFGAGYEVSIRMKHVEDVEEVAMNPSEYLGVERCVVETVNGDRLTIRMPQKSDGGVPLKLSALFTTLLSRTSKTSASAGTARAKRLRDFTVTQTSVESIFIHLTQQAIAQADVEEEEGDDVDSSGAAVAAGSHQRFSRPASPRHELVGVVTSSAADTTTTTTTTTY
eukprot:PhM_4_TR18813/c3_g1_i1/m.35877/K05643/ABCA3; ATP-binding cassette, subfamily A (ABC1), member 3